MLDTKKRSYNETKVVTIIGPETSIRGEIRCKGTIRIEGEVSGRVQSDDTIVVLDTGKVQADLVAGQVIIGGAVKGNVFAQERIEITARGRLVGDITAPRVSISEGVTFEGKCSMKPPMAAGSAEAEAAAATPTAPGPSAQPSKESKGGPPTGSKNPS